MHTIPPRKATPCIGKCLLEKGFADIVFEPNRNCNLPAMIVELKWGHSAEEAVEQIKQKNYLDCLKNYSGDVLLVGVNYDKEKHHTCKIERVMR